MVVGLKPRRVKRGARTRCATNPFDATVSNSSPNPFGGTVTPSPFGGGGGAGGAASNPFAPVVAVPSGGAESTTADDDGGGARQEAYLSWADVRVFEVPPELRRPGKQAATEHVSFFGLEELFPGTGLQELFNSNATFRTGLRRAVREDLFVADVRASDKANAAISSLDSSLMVHWKSSETGYAALSSVLAAYGVEAISGASFIQTLGDLCGVESHGTLIDITSTGRRQERHSWHQDSGLERFTVMLGFPPESNWEGVGVFSHSAKLSHPLRQDGREGDIIEWESFKVGDELPVEVIGRPVYSAGREVMVYCDATHIHSAPDATSRESVWRFM